jgi:hypothetical protein
VNLNGTIQEVHEELLKLNPAWDDDYKNNTLELNSTISQRSASPNLSTRANFQDAAYFCGGRWHDCDYLAILDGVRYLRQVQGRPRNGPGPGNCGRVSCSYKSAIWWCNDVSNYLTNNLVLETYDFLYRTRAHTHLVVSMILLMALISFPRSASGCLGLA